MRYSSTLSLSSAVDAVGGQRHAWHIYPRERDQVPTVQKAGWAPGLVCTGRVGKNRTGDQRGCLLKCVDTSSGT
jgi:hypothetical protein